MTLEVVCRYGTIVNRGIIILETGGWHQVDHGHLTLNLTSLAVLYSFAGLVGGTSGIILIFINKREIESLRNLVADNVNGR
ncbi:hypothetical protein F2Q69_00031390 [Brassica cretica]|nr:hypothetical protein F2Q69_00031390 [Brassica cretica]